MMDASRNDMADEKRFGDMVQSGMIFRFSGVEMMIFRCKETKALANMIIESVREGAVELALFGKYKFIAKISIECVGIAVFTT